MQQVEVIVIESSEESQVQEVKDSKTELRQEEIQNEESKTTAADGDDEPEMTIQRPNWLKEEIKSFETWN